MVAFSFSPEYKLQFIQHMYRANVRSNKKNKTANYSGRQQNIITSANSFHSVIYNVSSIFLYDKNNHTSSLRVSYFLWFEKNNNKNVV